MQTFVTSQMPAVLQLTDAVSAFSAKRAADKAKGKVRVDLRRSSLSAGSKPPLVAHEPSEPVLYCLGAAKPWVVMGLELGLFQLPCF